MSRLLQAKVTLVLLIAIGLIGCTTESTPPESVPTTSSPGTTTGETTEETTGETTGEDPTATLTLWKAPHSNDDAEFFEAVLDQLVEAGTIAGGEFRVTPWDTWQATYTSAFAGDNPPDVHYAIDDFFLKFAANDQLLALDEEFPEGIARLSEVIDQSLWESATANGHIYGVPFLQAGISLVWNKDLFEAAGLDPDAPPATWADLVEYAALVTEANSDAYGYGMIDNTTGQMFGSYPSIMSGYGAQFQDEDGNWILDSSPEAAEGLSVLVDMYAAGSMAEWGTFVGHDINTAFLEGRIGMMLTFSSFLTPLLGEYPDLKMGIGRPPCGPVTCESWGGVGFWSIASQSDYPAEAWQLVEALSIEELVTSYMQLTTLFPARNDSFPFEDAPLLQAFQETQGDFMLHPRSEIDVWSFLSPQVENAIAGVLSSEEALRTASDEIRAASP